MPKIFTVKEAQDLTRRSKLLNLINESIKQACLKGQNSIVISFERTMLSNDEDKKVLEEILGEYRSSGYTVQSRFGANSATLAYAFNW